MALYKSCLVLSIPIFLIAQSIEETKLQSLYLMQQNKTEQSLQKYQEYTASSGRHDFDMLKQMGTALLHKGSCSDDHQVFLMSLFGAGLSGSSFAIDILEKGMFYNDPQIQLLALHFISKIDDDRADLILNRAMNSDFLSTRMETAYYLCKKKLSSIVGQIEGLMFRLPPNFKPFFPPLFALNGTEEATSVLKQLIEDIDVQVRIESILQVAKAGRDDFLPTLRKRLNFSHVAELEATLFAIGLLKDNASSSKLIKHSMSNIENIRIAASLALFQLGNRNYISQIETLAKKNNLFAITSLGQIPGAEDTLFQLAQSNDLQIRINAAMALLNLKDPRCAPFLEEILIQDKRDLAFQPTVSMGRSLTAMKVIPSAELRAEDPHVDLTYSSAIREYVLREAMHLPELQFLKLARSIFQKNQNDLVPSVIALLENLQTDQAKEVLKEGTAKITSPLIRNYCHLALYRLKEPGPHEEIICRWVMQQKGVELIQLKPMLPWKFRHDINDHSLTPEETSKLLIDSFMTIASKREEKNVAFLIDAIQHTNPLNRYALMGLLMRATE